jgi:hypothetical protein
MILPSPNFNMFANFFEANKDLMTAHSAMNKATNEIMGKKFYSNDTKKTWRVINAYEKGNFLNRCYVVLIEDISTELKWWTWQRWKHGWKHPRMMVPVEVLEEKFKKGLLVAIEYEWDEAKHFSEKDMKDACIISDEV